MLHYHTRATSFVFLLVAFAHTLQLIFGWKITVNEIELSNAFSFITISICVILSVIGLMLAKTTQTKFVWD